MAHDKWQHTHEILDRQNRQAAMTQDRQEDIELRQQLIAIVTRDGNSGRIPALLEDELTKLESQVQRYTEQRVLDARIEEVKTNPQVPTHEPSKNDNEWWDGFSQGERRVFRLWEKYKRARLRELQAQRQSLEDKAASGGDE